MKCGCETIKDCTVTQDTRFCIRVAREKKALIAELEEIYQDYTYLDRLAGIISKLKQDFD